jgi:hypothetical protein
VAGRFSKRHKRCIREDNYKPNKQVIAKLLIQMSLLARSEWNHVPISKYITGTDRPYCSRKDCFKLGAAL